jgi:uncharacterized protein YegP (UPF0339 family)
MTDIDYDDLMSNKKRKKAHFEIYKDKRGEYRFRLIAPNNEIIAVSESYKSKEACMKGMDSVIAYAAVADIRDKTQS